MSSLEIVGFEHLHLHTDFSVLDGYGTVDEYARRAPQINQRFLTISDHGSMGAIPRQVQCCEENGIQPIFAIELYVNPLQPEIGKDWADMSEFYSQLDETQKKHCRKSYHLLAIAVNEQGYSNLVRLSSLGWTKGFYYKPRVNHEWLMAHKEGIIFTSCCYNSEIGQAFDAGGDDAGFDMVEKYIEMFGRDNFYLEMMLLDFSKQKPYDKFIIKAHERYGLPLIITNDTHYCLEEDSHMQRLMLMVQTGKTIQEIQNALAKEDMADLFELQDQNLYMKSEEEINEKWLKDYSDAIDYELFKQAKMNTVKICERAKGVKLDRTIKLPEIQDANEQLKESIMHGFIKRRLPKNREYLERIKEEYELICRKEFSSYFLIQKMMTDEARRKCAELLGYGDGSAAVGPGRGSAVGALTCYCLGITDVDPIRHELLFSRFLSPARGGKLRKFRFSIDPVKVDEEFAEECPFDVPFEVERGPAERPIDI